MPSESSPEAVAGMLLPVPAEWLRRDVVNLVSPGTPETAGSFRANITVTSRPAADNDLKAALHGVRQGILQQRLPGLKFKNERSLQIGGSDALLIDMLHDVAPGKRPSGGVLLRICMVCIRGGIAYEVITASAADNAQDRRELEAVLSRVSFA